MSQSFTAHFADIFASISQIFGAFAGLLNGRLKGLLQKVGGWFDKMLGNDNTLGKSHKTELSGGSLKSGINSLFLNLFSSHSFNSNSSTIKQELVSKLHKTCSL